MQTAVNLFVFVILPDGRIVRAGRLLSRNLLLARRGGYEGFFKYEQDYLDMAGSFPLDPIHLPLSLEIFSAKRPHSGIHDVSIALR